MNSLGRSSKWPSYDSLPSTSSVLHSESEQTEDEADIFSEGEGDSVRITKSVPRDNEVALSGHYPDFPTHSDRLRIKRDHSKHSDEKTVCPGLALSPGAATLGSSSATPGDLAFAQKCADLCRFVRPLLELLHRLKSGRFEKDLSSFQQSVAMDRLQRILGILQRPDMGEKHLNNLLQIEMMLKVWFPQVAFQSTDTKNQTPTPRLPPHWRQNQLHMPVKKRKLSWPDPDCSGAVPSKQKQLRHGKHPCCQAVNPLDSTPTSSPVTPLKQKTPLAEEMVKPVWGKHTNGHEFTVITATLHNRLGLYNKRESKIQKQPGVSLHCLCVGQAAQDSSVSSSSSISIIDSP